MRLQLCKKDFNEMTLFLIDKILFLLLQKKNGALREWDYVKEHDEYVL